MRKAVEVKTVDGGKKEDAKRNRNANTHTITDAIRMQILIFSVMEDDKSLSDYGLTSTVAKAQQPAEVMHLSKIVMVMMI